MLRDAPVEDFRSARALTQQNRGSRYSTLNGLARDALSVRWLAESCGLPAVPYYPRMASALVADRERAAVACQHIAWWSRHPDAGSDFERAARNLPDTSDALRIAALRALDYDGLLYLQDDKIIGHVFFQRHGSALHAFSCWGDESLRGRIFFRISSLDFLAYASQCGGIARARVGGGHFPITTRVLTRLRHIAGGLGWRLHDDGWVDFAIHGSDHAWRNAHPGARKPQPG